VKPLFFERTRSGVRFASEAKQLVATSDRPVEPSTVAVAEYLSMDSLDARQTFFEGVERVRPSSALIVEQTREQEVFYWSPEPDEALVPEKHEVSNVFREHLVEAVCNRAETSTGMISHLSGGLDSSAITASARIAAEQGRLDVPFTTASAVFPGHEIDESRWIDEIVASQPFDHHSFVPRVDGVDRFAGDMWISDQPRVDRIRDMWDEPTSIGVTGGADLLVTGVGGDEILHQAQLVVDRLHSGSPRRRLADARLHAAWMDQSLISVIAQESRRALPPSVKLPLRRLLPVQGAGTSVLARRELKELLGQHELELPPFLVNFPSDTQQVVVGSTQHPLFGSLIEAEEARCAHGGIDLSMPYLDRDLVLYIASIEVADRPFDGRSKTLVREGFSGWLPESVLARPSATVADEYLDEIFTAQLAEFGERYPEISRAGDRFIDRRVYSSLMEAARGGQRGSGVREPLWAAWTLMTWLDGLDRYRYATKTTAMPDSIDADEASHSR
jgi:asparagine synthetase B (glutamine-hydrolysing)